MLIVGCDQPPKIDVDATTAKILPLFKSTSNQPLTHYKVADIEAAVQSGAAGLEVAMRTRELSNISIHEVDLENFPYQVFVVRIDSGTHYTLLVEGEDNVITLCGGMGGGIAHDLSVRESNEGTIVSYTVSLGSGFDLGGSGEYLIGSGGWDGARRRWEDQTPCAPFVWDPVELSVWSELAISEYGNPRIVETDILNCSGVDVRIAVMAYTGGHIDRILQVYAVIGENMWRLQHQPKFSIHYDEIGWTNETDHILFFRSSDKGHILKLPYAEFEKLKN